MVLVEESHTVSQLSESPVSRTLLLTAWHSSGVGQEPMIPLSTSVLKHGKLEGGFQEQGEPKGKSGRKREY